MKKSIFSRTATLALTGKRTLLSRSSSIFLLLVVCVASSCTSSQKTQAPTAIQPSDIDKTFSYAADQYKVLGKNLPADKFPKTYFPTTSKYEFSNSGWWCSGFYPGSLLLM